MKTFEIYLTPEDFHKVMEGACEIGISQDDFEVMKRTNPDTAVIWYESKRGGSHMTRAITNVSMLRREGGSHVYFIKIKGR